MTGKKAAVCIAVCLVFLFAGTARASAAATHIAPVYYLESEAPPVEPEPVIVVAEEQDGIQALYPFTAGQYDIPPVYEKPYVVGVDTNNQVITIVKKGESGEYDVPVKYFICSTGASKTPTPSGSYLLPGDERFDWLRFNKYNCYVRYPVRIFEDYFFHSLIYNQQDISTLSAASLKNIGKPVSHGCIRLFDDDAQWISENVMPGTMVIVYSGVDDPDWKAAMKPE